VTSKKVLLILLALAVVLPVGVAIFKFLPPGEFSLGTFEFGGRTRTYFLHIPPSYDGMTPTPLVIVLHGYTQSPQGIAGMTAFSAKSDKEGFIVVYPEGRDQQWNVGFGSFGIGTDDIGFINELINRLGQSYVIDPKRIYVTGFSNGAMMSYFLGAELSDRIAAIAPVAGTIGIVTNNGIERIPEPSQPVSVIVFHGTADTSVPYNGDGVLSVAESVAFWVEHDRCSTNAQNETSSDGRVIRNVYTGGTNGTEVVLYTVVGLGHDWPTYYIAATDIIWDFFKDHPKE
jgi:polyhydroxybutyrate depolymerase